MTGYPYYNDPIIDNNKLYASDVVIAYNKAFITGFITEASFAPGIAFVDEVPAIALGLHVTPYNIYILISRELNKMVVN